MPQYAAVEQFGFNPEVIASFSQITELLQPDYLELNELQNTGHSLRSTLKELYKLLVIELIRDQLSIPQNYSHEQILFELNGLDEIQKVYILTDLNRDLENWRNGNFEPKLQLIREQLYKYFQKDQITTQIGEKGLFALDKIGLTEDDTAIANELIDRGGIRQRIFNYQITPDELPNLIESAKNYAQITKHPREFIEMRNLEALHQLSQQAEFGDTIIERSLPVHDWQTDCMWRMFRKTFRLKQDGEPGELEECWDITILSLPPDADQVAMYPQLISAACMEAPAQLINTVSAEEFIQLASDPDPLAQLIVISGSNTLGTSTIANQIPTVSKLGGFDKLQAVDQRVNAQVNKIMDQLSPVSHFIVDAIASIGSNEQLESLTSLYQQSVAAALLPYLPQHKLKNLSAAAQSMIDSGELFDLVIHGQVDLNDYIAVHTDGEGIEFDGECGVLQIGNYSEMQQIDHSIAPIINSKDGVELTWLQTQAGNKVLAKCPNPRCSHKNLDPCLANCPQCGISTNGMREAYERGGGAFQNYVGNYNESRGMKSTANTQGVDNFFNTIFSGITGLFSWIFV